MDTKKKNLIGFIVSLTCFILVLLMFTTLGLGLTSNAAVKGSSYDIKGWGATPYFYAVNRTGSTFTDFNKIASELKGLSRGMYAFSVMTFLFVLLFTLYFAILCIGSYFGKELLTLKNRKLIGLIFSTGVLLFAILFMTSAFTSISDINKNIKLFFKSEDYIHRFTWWSYITIFLPIICSFAFVCLSIKLV